MLFKYLIFLDVACPQVIMENLPTELERQWHDLLSDPKGPRHYCNSRMPLFSSPPDQAFNDILRLVVNNSLLELKVCQSERSVFNHLVTRQGDLLIGIVLRWPRSARIDVVVAGTQISHIELNRNEPRLLLGEDNILPLLRIEFWQTRIKSSDPTTFDFIYGSLNGDARKELATKPWSVEFHQGTKWFNTDGAYVSVTSEAQHKNIIRCVPLWKQDMARQIQRTEVFEEELIAKTWHPTRFQKWCLDRTEG